MNPKLYYVVDTKYYKQNAFALAQPLHGQSALPMQAGSPHGPEEFFLNSIQGSIEKIIPNSCMLFTIIMFYKVPPPSASST